MDRASSDWFAGLPHGIVVLMSTISSRPTAAGTRSRRVAVRARRSPARARRALGRGAPGAALAAGVATAATALSGVVGLGSGPVLGIVLGLAAGALLDLGSARRRLDVQRMLKPGVRWAASGPLRAAVVVLGAELPLGAVAGEGARSLPGILITLTGCLLVARALGRRLGIPRRLRTLVGVGTGICGASAIAAVTPVIDAEETEVGYAVATIFLFNVLAVLLFPLLGHALGLGQRAFGVFSGTAVNDLSSVVAAATLYGAGSLHTAVIVKLTRTLMIVPISIILARRFAAAPGAGAAVLSGEGAGAGAAVLSGVGAGAGTGSGAAPEPGGPLGPGAERAPSEGPLSEGSQRHAARVMAAMRTATGLVPGFLVLFAGMAALRGAGAIPGSWAAAISEGATLLITLALSAVGLSVDLAGLRRAGLRPLALGAVLWITVSVLSLGCQAVGLL
ncbi:MAG TPA: putative sulfate exporter family transporter [Solirubrobacteraceae bacterium]|nr:putative sulfate exporter family transporter [Solirubrobacteraceae bacterium]